MKTVEDAAQDFCWSDDTDSFHPYAREFGMKAFKAGVEYGYNSRQPEIDELVETLRNVVSVGNLKSREHARVILNKYGYE